MTVPDSDQPEGTIVTELQRGYRIRDRVLRPALVAVASGPEAPGGPVDIDSSDEPADGPTVSFDPEPDAGGAGPIH